MARHAAPSIRNNEFANVKSRGRRSFIIHTPLLDRLNIIYVVCQERIEYRQVVGRQCHLGDVWYNISAAFLSIVNAELPFQNRKLFTEFRYLFVVAVGKK